jgi:hypothetical protein
MRRGAALTEFALLMPLLLALTLGAMQMSLIAQAALVVHTAAVAAARAAIADPSGARLSPHRAAALVCAPVTGPTLQVKASLPRFPAPPAFRRLAGRLPVSLLKTRAEVTLEKDEAVARVFHDFELAVPGVNRLFVWLKEGWVGLPGTTSWARARDTYGAQTRSLLYGSPHIPLVAQARLPAPWLGPRGVRPGPWPTPRRRTP